MMGWIAGAGAIAYYAMRYLMEPVQEAIAVALEKVGQGLEVDAQGVVTVVKATEAIGRLGQMWREAEGSVLGLRRALARAEASALATEKREQEAHADALRARERLAAADQTIRDLRDQLAAVEAKKGKKR